MFLYEDLPGCWVRGYVALSMEDHRALVHHLLSADGKLVSNM